MFNYLQFAFTVFAVGIVLAAPSTIRRIRANESDFRVSAPALIVLAATVLSTGAIAGGFLINAQTLKAEQVTNDRAENVGYAIQREWSFVAPNSNPDLTDLAMSDMDVFKDNKTALERGETIRFKTGSGKEVTVTLSSNAKGAEYYDAKVTYDGKVVESVSRTYKEDGKYPIESDNYWVNKYPNLTLKPVGQNT